MATIFSQEQEEQIREMQIPYDYDSKEYPIEVLVHKFNTKNKETEREMLFAPDYQRNYVWKIEKASRFIESLFLGLPIQPIFTHIMDEDGCLEIIDGVQRVTTIDRFIKNELKLKGLQRLDTLNGCHFRDLTLARQNKFKLISMRFYVITDKATESIRADLFDRINTSAETLNKSEVRRGLYQGDFYAFLLECCDHADFKRLCPISKDNRERFEDQELLLRFFAYSESYEDQKEFREAYKFLDDYIRRNNKGFNKNQFKNKFENLLTFVKRYFECGFAKTKNANSTPRVRFEAISVGVCLALEIMPTLKPVYMDWLNSDEFAEQTTSDSSNNKGRLKARVEFVRDVLLNKIRKEDLSYSKLTNNSTPLF